MSGFVYTRACKSYPGLEHWWIALLLNEYFEWNGTLLNDVSQIKTLTSYRAI